MNVHNCTFISLKGVGGCKNSSNFPVYGVLTGIGVSSPVGPDGRANVGKQPYPQADHNNL
jgi:hypothetical protein